MPASGSSDDGRPSGTLVVSAESGPPVNLLSAVQLRILARLRTLRPDAEAHWAGDDDGWTVELQERRSGGRRTTVWMARFLRDGTVLQDRSVI